MSEQTPASGHLVDGPADPEHDPTASYALEPDYVASLTSRVVGHDRRDRGGRTRRSTAQPLAHVPQSSDDDVAEAFARARRAQAAWARTSLDERAAMLLRLHDLVLERQDEIIDLIVLGVGQGPQARLRRAAAHRADRPLLRPHGAPAPRHRAQAGRRARSDPGRGQPRAQGRRRHHLALELPVHDGAVRRAARRCWPATPWSPSPTPRPCSRRCSAPSCSRRPASRGTCGRSWPGPARELGTADHRARRLHLLHRLDRDRQARSPRSAPSG